MPIVLKTPKLHSELRILWDRAGYSKNYGSAAVVPPPSKSYKRLYYLTSADHAISDIVFSRLKVATLDQLNDPFELIATRFLHNKEMKVAVNSYKDQLAKEYGILCFSGDWTDPVLWTHYAVKHTGMCLGFDVPADLVIKVDYQKNRLQADGRTLDKTLQRQLLRTKYESWKYENESRVQVRLKDAIKEGGLYFERIGERVHLAEVILGAKCLNRLQDVRRVVDKHHEDVVVFSSRLANGSFFIVPHEPSVPKTPQFMHVR